MLRDRIITVGKCYVNNHRKIAREVLEANDEIVKFNTFHLVTGNSCGSPSECTKHDFINWVDREVSPAEAASLESHEMDAWLYAPQMLNPKN